MKKASEFVIVLDAGHQEKADLEKEPIGFGAIEKKPKVSAGTKGVVTGLKEYQLNLQVSLKLQKLLEEQGYKVVMTRTTNDVNISNSQRAKIANKHKADAFIRIHADYSENPNDSGAMTICQTPSNPYNKNLYFKSKALSKAVLDNLVLATACSKRDILETDTMTGINWCKVPVTIVETGFMSNPKEDLALANEDYQWKIAKGIANGIVAYLNSDNQT